MSFISLLWTGNKKLSCQVTIASCVRGRRRQTRGSARCISHPTAEGHESERVRSHRVDLIDLLPHASLLPNPVAVEVGKQSVDKVGALVLAIEGRRVRGQESVSIICRGRLVI